VAASSARWSAAAAFTAVSLLACSIGRGEGSVTGTVRVPSCRLTDDTFDLGVNFFGAELINDPERRDPTRRRERMLIRLQRGTYREADSDGLLISVDDVNEVERELLDVPIEIGTGPDARVRMTLYLGQRCLSGFPDSRWTRSVIMAAQSGTIRFSDIYAPAIGDAEIEIAATFDEVVFSDPAEPEWSAVLSGAFRFAYQRGAPAQAFP
jgi:hypothetical protein